MTEGQTISVRELHERSQREDIVLIDVRTPAEFQALHAACARNMPLDALDVEKVARWAEKGPVYVICQAGTRSRKACQALADKASVVDVQGGTKAWASAGFPVVRGRRAMSLERQVRVAAGSLVVVGAVLAVTVNAWFALISGFVGAGLVYSGVTDSCAMAMMLAKMPWNQIPPAESAPNSKADSHPKAA